MPITRKRTITLSDGEAREVRFTFGTFERVAAAAGLELEDFRDKAKMTQLITRRLSLFIWASLSKADRKALSPEDVGDLIEFGDMPRITAELMEALGGSAGENGAGPIEAVATLALVQDSASSNAGPSPSSIGDSQSAIFGR